MSERKDRFPFAFALANAAVGFGFVLAAVRAAHLSWTWLLGGGVPLGFATAEIVRFVRGEPPLTRREIVEVEPGVPPRRTKRLRRATRRFLRGVVPSWSARTTVLVVVTSFLLTGLLLPKALALPRFVEFELVLGSWWAILWVVLGVLLYRGARLADDHSLSLRGLELGGLSRVRGVPVDVALELGGCFGLDGILGVLALGLIAVAASWLLVDLAFPALFFLAYVLLRGALARVTNDEHGCAYRLGRSAAWALVWSGVYTAPLALVSYVVHFALLHA
ncbi:MAG TPA: hypothetical protein VMI54_30200 [Polyangiaceae bacterium]|nr:hypothetical protein [Polyangiaceae bacterium]